MSCQLHVQPALSLGKKNKAPSRSEHRSNATHNSLWDFMYLWQESRFILVYDTVLKYTWRIQDRNELNCDLTMHFLSRVWFSYYFRTLFQLKREYGYHSDQKLLPSRLLSKIVKIRIHKTIILPVVLYGCETWSLTLRKEHRLRVFEKSVLKIFGPKRDEVREVGESCIRRSFITCSLCQV
jgi:hypothetical protein